jgi:hypothetical protein
MRYLYDDIAYVIRNAKTNKWLKSYKTGRSYWSPSIVNAVICDADTVNSFMKKLHKTSHAKHVQIRKIGVIDD